MLLLLDEDHKSDLQLLDRLGLDVLADFVRISIEFLKNGVNKSKLTAAANKLKVEPDVVTKLVEGLMFLLAESSKLMLSEVDFHDSVMTLGVSEEICGEIVRAYLENRAAIRLVLQELSLHPVQYHDLEWRLNVKLASRSLQGQLTPNVLMRLHTTQGASKDSQLLECDIPNLVNLTNSLDDALQESKSQYTRRILRNIK
ncbi:COMM domain-containing protein 2-like [Watersipora subatra]|uniref:COMM domain-containing protein 2-like n=1 Tax=Watersipora subatra TaxID=2589382 RepID=UPI00355AD43D